MRYNLYYIFREEQTRHPIPPERVAQLLKLLEALGRKEKPP